MCTKLLKACLKFLILNLQFSHFFLVPPSTIIQNGNRVFIDEGITQFLINCTTTGIPVPNITWSDPNGIQLPNINNTRISVLPDVNTQLVTSDGVNFVHQVTLHLQITNTSKSDSGIYTCVADNGVGIVSRDTVKVFIKG